MASITVHGEVQRLEKGTRLTVGGSLVLTLLQRYNDNDEGGVYALLGFRLVGGTSATHSQATYRTQVEGLVHDLVACCEVPVVLEGFLYLDEDVDGLRARELLTGWLSGRGTWSVPKERCTRPRTREVGEGLLRPGRPLSEGKATRRLLVCRS